jgi:outer membrane protein
MHTTGIYLGRITLPLVAAGMLLLASLPVAQATEAFKMGVVDPQAVLEKSKAGKKALDGLKEYVSTRQKLLSGDEEELRNTEKTLKEQLTKLSDTEKKDK